MFLGENTPWNTLISILIISLVECYLEIQIMTIEEPLRFNKNLKSHHYILQQFEEEGYTKLLVLQFHQSHGKRLLG